MARFPNPIFISDFMSGMVSDVSETITPKNSVALAVNIDFDQILGAATGRPGLSAVGSQLVAGKDILGLYQHVDPTNASNNLLLAALNASGDATATIKNVASGSDVVTGLTASTRVRFLTYGGETLAINGADAPRAWNNSTWITTGGVFDLADWPANESSLVIEFLDRIYANDESVPYRIHYTTLFDGSAITWNGDYIDLEPEDQGGKITAFAKVPGYVLFFKERSLHRWNYSSAFPESLVQIGAPSQESVVESGGLVFFYSNSSDEGRGFYVTNGGRPQCISKDTTRTVRRFVDAIATANEAEIVGSATDRVVQWSVGDLTVDGETFSNVVLRYNRILNQWSIRTYPSRFMSYAKYLVGGVNARVAGDDDGTVYRIDAPGVYDDNGADIPYLLRTHSESYGTNRLKSISDKMFIRGSNLTGVDVAVVPDGDITRRQNLTGSRFLRKILNILKIGKKVAGTTFAVELSGEYKENQPIVKEIEMPEVVVSVNYEQ